MQYPKASTVHDDGSASSRTVMVAESAESSGRGSSPIVALLSGITESGNWIEGKHSLIMSVSPGQELELARKLADRLRGVNPDGPDRTVVADLFQLKLAAAQLGISPEKLAKLFMLAETI